MGQQTWDRHTDMGQTYRHGTDIPAWDRYTYRYGTVTHTDTRHMYRHGTNTYTDMGQIHIQGWHTCTDMELFALTTTIARAHFQFFLHYNNYLRRYTL
jgi:hypothetical protein